MRFCGAFTSLVAGLFLSSGDAFSVSPLTRRLGGSQLRKIAPVPNMPHAFLHDDVRSSSLFMTPRGNSETGASQRAKFADFMQRFRTTLIGLTFAILVLFSAGIANASTGGRMGGSFGRSSSGGGGGGGGGGGVPSYSRTRSYSTPSRTSYPSRTRSPVIIDRRPNVYYSPRLAPQPAYYQNPRSSGGFSVADVVVVGGVVGFIAWKASEGASGGDGDYSTSSSALGPGVSVASLTVALEVPDRKDGDNILSRIRKLSQTANTSTRKGVQDLVNNVSLELLRQAPSMHSATSYSKHYGDDSKASRDFQRLSVDARSKFDEETLNKFNDVNMSFEAAKKNADIGKATMAVVTINMCIEGDQTKIPKIKNKETVATALQRIASDAQVGECLISAEVLWAPEDSDDRLSIEQVYSSYPDLFPL